MGFRLIFAAKLRGVFKLAGGCPPEIEVVSNKLFPKSEDSTANAPHLLVF